MVVYKDTSSVVTAPLPGQSVTEGPQDVTV